MTETFRCERLSMAITRGSCAALYERHNRLHAKDARMMRGVAWAQCTGCPIGHQHARGQMPDVPLVPLSTPPPVARPYRQRTCTGCGAPIPRSSWRKHTCSMACAQRAAAVDLVFALEQYG